MTQRKQDLLQMRIYIKKSFKLSKILQSHYNLSHYPMCWVFGYHYNSSILSFFVVTVVQIISLVDVTLR